MLNSTPMQRALEILQNTFGYEAFRHQQSAIIEHTIAGNDALVLMPTGGGKSLCYQIPALIRSGVGIVVSPLIALMQDQVDSLNQLGVKAAYLNSSLDNTAQQAVLKRLSNGELDLLYVAPERLLTHRMIDALQYVDIALFAIDEAHCVSQWGHDFRRDYQQLYRVHELFPNVPRIALTATADDRTRSEIVHQLQLGEAGVFVNSFDRPNIQYTISDGQNARDRLWRFISQNHAQDAGIVYCLSRKNVEKVAQWLSEKGRVALPYHAGLSNDVRQTHQRRFLREEGVIVVATIAFGMGIDKPDVRFVAHLNLPKSIEAYYQETGRAGRDGTAANAWMNYGLQDIVLQRQMTQDSDADEHFKKISNQKLESLIGLCETTDCRRQSLLAYFGETLDKPCGNCDVCLSPPQTWDATQAAQQALSAVYRSGQQFGVNYIIDILTGKSDDRIIKNGHDKLTTFGIGASISVQEWRSIFRQLVARRLVDADMARYGALFLTEQARPLLRGEIQLHLRKTDAKRGISVKSKQTQLRAVDEALFDALRTLRRQLAEEMGVPPYIVFHDNSLQEMARKRPISDDEFRFISGVGEQKSKRYAQAFIEVIRQHPLPSMLENRLSDTVNETLFMLTQRKTAEQIAVARGVSISTVYNHFAEAIDAGLLDPKHVLDLDDAAFDEIVFAIETAEDDRLKPIYESLEGAHDYGVIKCVQASL